MDPQQQYRARHSIRLSVRSAFFIAALAMTACVAQVDDDDESVAQGATEALVSPIDFESYALGPIGAPWSTFGAGASSSSVVNTSDHGHVLLLNGSTREGDFLSVGYPFESAITTDITVRFDVKPTTGSAPIFLLSGSGRGYKGDQLRLTRAIGSDTLLAGYRSTPCGTLPSERWSSISLTVRTAGTFDVAIDGVTVCSNVPTPFKAPYVGISVIDASNPGWGGKVYWDNFGGF